MVDAAGDKKTPKAPAEDVVTAFLKWLWEEKYPGWKLPLVFVKVKCVLGCRLMDLCSLRAEQLVGGRVEFDAEQVKGRADHTGALPAEVAAELAEVRGPSTSGTATPQSCGGTSSAAGSSTGG